MVNCGVGERDVVGVEGVGEREVGVEAVGEIDVALEGAEVEVEGVGE